MRRQASAADHRQQAHRDDRLDRLGKHQPGLLLHRLGIEVDHAADRLDDVQGVQRGEHQVPGEGGLDRDLCGLVVADAAGVLDPVAARHELVARVDAE